ncbi:MAG: DEAD/DEAH box helicase [Acholeplasma sp.]|nr:DEAD/DEAH box helicase [Acholeplasma sp.]
MKKLFSELEILEQTKQAINEIGINELTEIQELAIPLMLEGKDFIAQAQTGTGKTFAFAIPIIEKINSKIRNTQSLVLCPTRELALQVYNEFLKLVKFNERITVTPIVGGESYERQFKALKRKPHIIVGTPGRIIDHMERRTVDFSNLEILTFDEADEMLKMGFQEDIERILSETRTERQTVLFSATIPNEIKKIATKYQKDASIIKVDTKQLTVSTISQHYYVVKKQDKLSLLKRLMAVEMADSIIVFANTKKEVDEISLLLNDEGYNAQALHGDLKQSQRNYVMNMFRNRELNVLVATDVAARGLDISNVDCVINYELPHENEVYVHRIGRTGRAGKSGKAYSIVTPRTEMKIWELEKFTKTKIERKNIPATQTINAKRIEKFIDKIVNESHDVTDSYDKIIEIAESKGVDSQTLLAYFIGKEIPKEVIFDDIDIVKAKDDKKQGSKNDKDNNRRNTRNRDFVLYQINLGRKDRVNPQLILEIIRTKYNVNSKNVGDIKHFDKHTVLQISNKASAIIGDLGKFVFRGKNIRLEML